MVTVQHRHDRKISVVAAESTLTEAKQYFYTLTELPIIRSNIQMGPDGERRAKR